MRRRWTWLVVGAILLVAVVALSVWLIVESDHNDAKWASISFALPVGVSFVVAGLVALARRPENRTGLYLTATGFVWFFGALDEGNANWLYTASVALGSLTFIPFTLLMLSFPTGRLETAWERRYIRAVAAAVVFIPLASLLTIRSHETRCTGSCRESVIALTDSRTLFRVVDVSGTIAGLGLTALGIVLLERAGGARPPRPAARCASCSQPAPPH